MFDFDAGKLLIIAVVALVVIGPKELPRVLRQVGQVVARVRRMAAEFQGQFMDAMKEADLDSIRKDIAGLGNDADLKVAFDPARDIQRELTAALDKPEAVAALPALADDSHAVPTEGFALPPGNLMLPLQQPSDGTSSQPTAAGSAPMSADGIVALERAPEPSSPVDGFHEAASFAVARKKRKIRMPKRRGLARSRVHAVTDRTALPRALAPLYRAQDAAGR